MTQIPDKMLHKLDGVTYQYGHKPPHIPADSNDGGDVFAFDVPNHTITVSLTMDSGVDFDLLLHRSNGSIIDSGSFQ